MTGKLGNSADVPQEYLGEIILKIKLLENNGSKQVKQNRQRGLDILRGWLNID